MLGGILTEASSYVLKDDIYRIHNNSRYEIGHAFYTEGMGLGEKINILVGLEDKETIRGILWISNYEHLVYRDLLV
jgi:hypothetical protein